MRAVHTYGVSDKADAWSGRKVPGACMVDPRGSDVPGAREMAWCFLLQELRRRRGPEEILCT